MTRKQSARGLALATTQASRPAGSLRLQPSPLYSPRMPELDALRGLMLVGMMLTHLPTGASHYANQLLGFVSWAEGFVLLSALLAGRVYGARLQKGSLSTVVKQLWRRSARVYSYHLALLALAFTVFAVIAVRTQEPALQGLLDFYLANRAVAAVSSVLLLYCPPLLDILPMYIVFLFLTPLLLKAGQRWGWRFILAPSALLWLAAQFGLRGWLHGFLSAHTGFPVPLQNLGAFDMFAWQFLWVFGLWAGSQGAESLHRWFKSRWTIAFSVLVVALFFVMRYQLVPYLVTHPVDQGDTWVLFDKWQLGALRLLNFAAFGVLFTTLRPYIARRLAWTPLVLLGKSSLEVFSVQVFFCFAALSLVGDGTRAPLSYQVAILAVSLAGLFAVAYLRARPQQSLRAAPIISLQSRPELPTVVNK